MITNTSDTEAPRQWLSFRMDGEEYGIDVLQVQEIHTYQAPTPLYNAPDYVNGVLDLRGEVVPVIDLRSKLGLQRRDYDESTVTIMLRLARGLVGMVVDSVTDVVTLLPQQLRTMPVLSDSAANDYLLAMGVQDERALILVDAGRLMDGAVAGL